MIFRRKYAVASAAATHVRIKMTKAGFADFATDADWSPAAGDVKVSKDGGAEANIATLPTYANGWWVFTFSAAELTAAQVGVSIVDSATKAVDDNGFVVETFGHASAMHPFDLGTASTPQTGDSFARIGAAGAGLTALGDTRLANLDAAVSSRSTFAGGAVASVTAGVTLADGAITAAKIAAGALAAAKFASDALTAIANAVEAEIIDEADSEKVLEAITNKIAAVNPSLAGLTLAAIAAQVRTELTTELGRLDVAVSSRLATAGYTAPPSAAAIADAVFDEAMAGHTTAGTFGKAVADLGTELAKVPRLGLTHRYTNQDDPGKTADVTIGAAT